MQPATILLVIQSGHPVCERRAHSGAANLGQVSVLVKSRPSRQVCVPESLVSSSTCVVEAAPSEPAGGSVLRSDWLCVLLRACVLCYAGLMNEYLQSNRPLQLARLKSQPYSFGKLV